MSSLSNEGLAHRVIMDPQFQLSKGQRTSMQGGKQVHAQVEAAMKRAYWDMIRQQTAAGGAWALVAVREGVSDRASEWVRE